MHILSSNTGNMNGSNTGNMNAYTNIIELEEINNGLGSHKSNLPSHGHVSHASHVSSGSHKSLATS